MKSMIKLRKFIEKISNKKNIKIMLIIFLVVWCFVWQTFAADNGTQSTTVLMSEVMDYIVKVLSWFWVILANLAWKLMTNDLLYWEFLHLDVTLWTLWQIMKNFANFALWFILLFSIFKWIINQEQNKIIDIVKKTLVSWILIQMSRFIIWAMVDVSTILTTAVWAFPAQIIASDDETKLATTEWVKEVLRWNKITIWSGFIPEKPEPKDAEMTQDDVKASVDAILPWTDSMAWPLIFLWVSVFNFFDKSQVTLHWESWSELFLQIGINGIVLLAYTIMMFFIFLFNLLRLLVLWVIIPLTPIIVVMHVFKWKLSLWTFLESVMKIENIIKLIFKPVIMVWALSVILIVMLLLKNLINHDNPSIIIENTDVQIQSTKVEDNSYNSSISMWWDLVKFNMDWFKDSIADILLYVVWLCLVYFLMKMTVKSGTWIGFVDDKLNKLMDNTGKFLSNLPIIPVWWWKAVWRSVLSEAIERKPSSMIDAMRNDQTEILRNDNRFKWLFPDETSWKIFSELDVSMERDKFIETAYRIAESHGLINKKYWIIDDKDNSLQIKMNAWNDRNTANKPSDRIWQNDVVRYPTKKPK